MNEHGVSPPFEVNGLHSMGEVGRRSAWGEIGRLRDFEF